jgi:hypothetical protein
MLVLLSASAISASAEYIVYPMNTDVDWRNAYPNASAPELGDCVGNCGSGCSDGFNPGCGPDTQRWELQILSEAQPTGYIAADILCWEWGCYYYEFMQMQAMGRWTYHGYFAWGCFFHDAICPEFFGIGCVWYSGCGSGWEQDWSYDSMVFGWKTNGAWQIS